MQTEPQSFIRVGGIHVRNLFKNLSNWNSLPLQRGESFMNSLQDTINWECKEEATRKWRKLYSEELHNF
jgi:hypothetical protein